MLLSRAAIRPLFELHVHFFHENEIFSEDIENVKMSSFLHLLFDIGIISGVTRGLSQGGNLAKKGQLASTQKKNLRNEGESGCGWSY